LIKNIFEKIIISIILISMFIFITSYRDSSLSDDFDEAALLLSNTSTAKTSTVKEDVTSVHLSISENTSSVAVSQITLSK